MRPLQQLRLPRDLVFLLGEDGVKVLTDSESAQVKGAGFYTLLERLAPFLARGISMSDLTGLFRDDSRETGLAFCRWLIDKGFLLVEDFADPDAIESVADDPMLDLFARDRGGQALPFASWRRSRVVVAGDELLCLSALQTFATLGVGGLTLLVPDPQLVDRHRGRLEAHLDELGSRYLKPEVAWLSTPLATPADRERVLEPCDAIVVDVDSAAPEVVRHLEELAASTAAPPLYFLSRAGDRAYAGPLGSRSDDRCVACALAHSRRLGEERPRTAARRLSTAGPIATGLLVQMLAVDLLAQRTGLPSPSPARSLATMDLDTLQIFVDRYPNDSRHGRASAA